MARDTDDGVKTKDPLCVPILCFFSLHVFLQRDGLPANEKRKTAERVYKVYFSLVTSSFPI